jgi:predicted nuclease of predicted toxin-antitoxin system
VKPPLLADENIPRTVVAGLRAAGFDVLTIAELAPGAIDHLVLAKARQRGRWLITFDADFGELIFREGAPPPPGVLYLRTHPIIADRVLAMALRALSAGVDSGFVVVGDEGERVRSFTPSAGGNG